MTDKTATQNLTRTVASDDPRQMAAYLKSLATDADLRMAAHFRDLARSQGPPFACLQVLNPVSVDQTLAAGPWTGTVPFDTVAADTAGMVDLSVSVYQINFVETGWWWVGMYLLCDGFGSSADVYGQLSANGDAQRDARHDALIGNIGCHTSFPVRVTSLITATPVFLSMASSSSTRNTTTISYAEMFACKLRDL